MTNRQLTLATACLALSTAAPYAAAQDDRAYVGLGVGQSSYDISASDINSAFTSAGMSASTELDEEDTAWNVFGGYRLNDNFAVEAAYWDFGEIGANTGVGLPVAGTVNSALSADTISISLLAGMPMGKAFVYGRIGAAFWDAQSSAGSIIAGAPGSASADDDGTDLVYGLGAWFNFNPALAGRVEWQRFQLGGDTDIDVDVLGIAVQLQF